MKSGLEYFPLDTLLDDKFALIEAEFGLQGFAVIIKLYQKIYGGEGYYCLWNDEVALLFGRQCGLGGSAVSEIVSAGLRRGIFDKQMYEEYGILTSEGIQKRYIQCARRREKVVVNKQYLLGDYTQNLKNVYISDENVYRNAKNVYRKPQSKVKESKVKESKVKRDNAPARNKYGEYLNVLLTEDELEQWKAECPQWLSYVNDLSGYMKSSGKGYKDHLATMRNWYIRDKEQGKVREQKRTSYDLDKEIRKAIEEVPTYPGRSKK